MQQDQPQGKKPKASASAQKGAPKSDKKGGPGLLAMWLRPWFQCLAYFGEVLGVPRRKAEDAAKRIHSLLQCSLGYHTTPASCVDLGPGFAKSGKKGADNGPSPGSAKGGRKGADNGPSKEYVFTAESQAIDTTSPAGCAGAFGSPTSPCVQANRQYKLDLSHPASAVIVSKILGLRAKLAELAAAGKAKLAAVGECAVIEPSKERHRWQGELLLDGL
eukprot:scaffold2732_cov22-Tisochrysis_lutea.AAC.1